MSEDLFTDDEQAVVDALIREQNMSPSLAGQLGESSLDISDTADEIRTKTPPLVEFERQAGALLLGFPAYDGPPLMPAERAICGWCTRSHACKDCSVWMNSPGSDPAKKYHGKIPCIHPCSDEKVAFLRSVYGEDWSPGKRSKAETDQPLHSDNISSSVPQVIRTASSENETEENQVSETTTEDVTVMTPTEDAASDFPTETGDYETPADEPTPEVGSEGPTGDEPVAEPTEDAAEAPAEDEAPTAEPTEAKATRAPRTDLEPDVKAITDAFVTEEITVEGDLTPHKVAKLVGERRAAAGGDGKAPSSGAVSAVFERWEKYNFAVIQAKPYAFLDYTDEGRTHGLSAMKAKHREALKAAKAANASA